jgi:hypothetical protein
MLACSRGLFFADVNDFGEVRVTLNANEVYFREQDIKGAVELKRDLIATCMDMDTSVHIIDRKTKSVVRQIDIPSGSDNPLCLRLIPGFDLDKFPYLLLRDKEGVSIINVKFSRGFKCLQIWYQQLPFPQMLMECYKALSGDSSTEASTFLHVLEYNGKDSALVKYELSADYLGALRIMASNDF